MRVLTLIDAFLPGYRYGGPLRTVAAMVEGMTEEFQFWVLTRDRDLGDQRPYPGIALDRWLERGSARVRYMSPGHQGWRSIAKVVRDLDPDLVYANSLFSSLTRRYLVARRLGRVPRHPLLLAPRGELSPAALRRKHYKKWPFLRLATLSGLFRDASWQASTALERDEMAKAFRGPLAGAGGRIFVARDLVTRGSSTAERGPKAAGAARLVFLSRIVPNKNLLQAISALEPVRGHVQLDVYGPIEDREYWDMCVARSRRLGAAIRFSYHGELPHDRVGEALAGADFLVLPTRFENFGHVIAEAFMAGCPVIVSDQTSWRGLEEQRAGFDLPLDDHELWVQTLQRCVDMAPEEHAAFRRGAAVIGVALRDGSEASGQTASMLRAAAGTQGPGDVLTFR